MHRLLGGLIYAVANSKHLSLNFYPILAELGIMSERLFKQCAWSPKLFEILKNNCKPMHQRLTNEEEIQNWCRTIKDVDMGNNLRLFMHSFVPIPTEVFDENVQKEER